MSQELLYSIFFFLLVIQTSPALQGKEVQKPNEMMEIFHIVNQLFFINAGLEHLH